MSSAAVAVATATATPLSRSGSRASQRHRRRPAVSLPVPLAIGTQEPNADGSPGASMSASAVADQVCVFAPATIANLGPGFDWLGCAVDGMGDRVRAKARADWAPGTLAISGGWPCVLGGWMDGWRYELAVVLCWTVACVCGFCYFYSFVLALYFFSNDLLNPTLLGCSEGRERERERERERRRN